jgi:sugar phosphate isomerase/epimerase
LAAEAGVKMVSSTVNYRLWGVSPAWLEWAKANILLDIEIGGELGLEVLRMAEVGVPFGRREEEVFDEIAQTGALLNELAKHAEKHGVTIMCENHRASSDLMLAVASHFTSPNVGIHFDAFNYCRVGEDPVKALRRVKDFVRYCHFKDFRPEDAQGVPTDTWWPSWAVGDGQIDWRSLLEELGSFYNGVVAIEYEKSLHDVLSGFRRSIDHVRGIMAEVGIKEDRLRPA